MLGPLEGFRVVDLADGVAGPYAAMELGDAGADVIKIERPGGDRSRNWGSKTRGDYGVAFLQVNRNKRGVTIDVDSDAGAAIASRLIERADVVITDAGWSVRPELQPDSLVAHFPKLVCCNVSQYGERGPWANRPPYGELAVQMTTDAVAGLGRVGDPPLRIATDFSSMIAGIHAAMSISAALFARDVAGGQRIDVSLLGSLIANRPQVWAALSDPQDWHGFHLDWFLKPPDIGNLCKDGPILFTIPDMPQETREKLYANLDMLWVRDDPLYAIMNEDKAGIHGRFQWLARPLWNRALSKFTIAEVAAITEPYGCEVFPWNTYQQMTEHPQFRHLGIEQTVEHPGIGAVREIAPPWNFFDTPVPPLRPAPTLGEHTTEVLAESGFSSSEVAEFRRNGLLGSI